MNKRRGTEWNATFVSAFPSSSEWREVKRVADKECVRVGEWMDLKLKRVVEVMTQLAGLWGGCYRVLQSAPSNATHQYSQRGTPVKWHGMEELVASHSWTTPEAHEGCKLYSERVYRVQDYLILALNIKLLQIMNIHKWLRVNEWIYREQENIVSIFTGT